MTSRDCYRIMTAALTPVYGDTEAGSIARIALEDGLNITNLSSEVPLDDLQTNIFNRILTSLLNNEPIQYITGKTKFAGLWLKTDPRALIPRQETEELVALLLEDYKYQKHKPLSVLDIGTGSGCIAISIKKKYPAWKVTAIDISPDALSLASENAVSNRCEITFQQSDILDETAHKNLPFFDIVISNPPYIPFREKHLMPEQVLNNEPSLALFVPDEHPLLFYKAILNFCKKKLRPDGSCYLECNEFNAADVLLLFQNNNFDAQLEMDIQGKERFVKVMSDE